MSRDRKVLLIAYVFPPFGTVGHVQRVVKFAKYLPQYGWTPLVLTIRDDYPLPRNSASIADDVASVSVHRTSTVLVSGGGSRGQSPVNGSRTGVARRMARAVGRNILIPDPNVLWLPFAVRAGLALVRRHNIDAIFATAPPHSTALVGFVLKRLTRKPTVIDFRDDWVETPVYDSKTAPARRIENALERGVIKAADRVTLVTEWSRAALEKRYPALPASRFTFLPNGCDLDDFPPSADPLPAGPDSPFVLFHSGTLNEYRDLTPFFRAIQELGRENQDFAARVQVVFGGGLPPAMRTAVHKLGLSGCVREIQYLDRPAFIARMVKSSVLLAVAHQGFPTLIPGKLYDYWAAGRPILLLADDCAARHLLNIEGLGCAASPGDSQEIKSILSSLFRAHTAGTLRAPDRGGLEKYDRNRLSGQLAHILDEICH